MKGPAIYSSEIRALGSRFEWPAFSFDERHWHLSSFVGDEADEEDFR